MCHMMVMSHVMSRRVLVDPNQHPPPIHNNTTHGSLASLLDTTLTLRPSTHPTTPHAPLRTKATQARARERRGSMPRKLAASISWNTTL